MKIQVQEQGGTPDDARSRTKTLPQTRQKTFPPNIYSCAIKAYEHMFEGRRELGRNCYIFQKLIELE